MRRESVFVSYCVILAGLQFLSTNEVKAAEPVPPRANAGAAEKLVQAALTAELASQNGERRQLLLQALTADPEHAPARWQSGYVKFDGRWLTIEQVAAVAGSDAVRKQYAELRAKTVDDVAGQLKLAKWCRDHKLTDAANAHAMRVLALEPDNAQARAQLGFRRFQGGWATEDQVAAFQAAERQQKQIEATWKPKLESICRRLAEPSEKVQQAAKNELLAIRDPDAIGPLLRYLAGVNTQIDNILAEVFGRMEGPDTVQALLQVAVLSEFSTARTAAADQLKKRDLDSFAPLLLAGMFKPITTRDELRHTGQGIYLWRRTIEGEGQFAVSKSVTDELVVSYADGARLGKSDRPKMLSARRELSDEKLNSMPRVDDQHRAAAIQTAAVSDKLTLRQQSLEEQNRRIVKQNERIAALLNYVTEQDLEVSPEMWWKWWNDRYEMTTVKRRNATYGIRVNSLMPAWIKNYRPIPSPYLTPSEVLLLPMWRSCFAAGTKVSTIDGQRPIEEVRLGDLVLSQDPQTGELAYKTVLQTTLRPALPLSKIHTGDEAILCTPGHPFWVNGRGWTMAKELVEGFYLHGRAGAVPLWKMEAAPAEPTYNLVVADFHSYFVGQAGLLVHDNGLWEPTDAVIPGMAAK